MQRNPGSAANVAIAEFSCDVVITVVARPVTTVAAVDEDEVTLHDDDTRQMAASTARVGRNRFTMR
jgi:molybdopterin/thiamine biosynthesis adenylyltransferase